MSQENTPLSVAYLLAVVFSSRDLFKTGLVRDAVLPAWSA